MVSLFNIARHKTAIRRPGFSLPIRCLLEDGLLTEARHLFDFGCGLGQDIKLLPELGISATGWDPVHHPSGLREEADIVNLGYVINVIESPQERAEVLRTAWSLARYLLVVAAQLDTAAPIKPMPSFSDGIITSRDTFQKYYTQPELRSYIENTLSTDVVSAAPGVFYIFRDDGARQEFLARRYRRSVFVPSQRVPERLFEQNQDVLEPFVQTLTNLGRLPGPEEFGPYDLLIERLGSAKRALAVVKRATGAEPWGEIAMKRAEDLLVYLALSRFERRPPFSQLPLSIQRDTKAFFTTYQKACAEADALLFSIGNENAVNDACCRAKVGALVENALLLHRDILPETEPLLRIYEGCARALVGDVEGANVVKLHRFSSKVSYLVYPNFELEQRPILSYRVKVTLPTRSIQFFDHRKDSSTGLEEKDSLLRRGHLSESERESLPSNSEIGS